MKPFFRELIEYLPPAPSLRCGIPDGFGNESLSEELVEIAVERAVRYPFVDEFRDILLDSDSIGVFFQAQDGQQNGGLIQRQIFHFFLLIYLYGISVKMVTKNLIFLAFFHIVWVTFTEKGHA
jgi:hypothetical protein